MLEVILMLRVVQSLTGLQVWAGSISSVDDTMT